MRDCPERIMTDPSDDQKQPKGTMRRAADELLDRIDPVSFGRSLAATAVGLARHPLSVLSAYQHFAVNALGAAQAVTSRMMGTKTPGLVEPSAKDRRFADPAWQENPLFFALQQAHFLRERLVTELGDAAGLEEQTTKNTHSTTQPTADAL